MGTGTEIAIMLRRQLRQRREDLGMSQADVGEAIGREIDESPPTKQAISNWERFVDQPRIDAFAAWARAVGLRLHVQLYDPAVERVAVRVPPQAEALCAVMTDLRPEEIAHLLTTAKMLLRSRSALDSAAE